ncbi:8-oxoguanine deaminase [Leucothrix arctica]|uniref:8-oxoguanine deaminase n=2 Tax=Leucothrix arctica TaxID=1481894 RepID=A0A317CGK2_9GAMM|nr:8-oxoguanine deaminase [Leucothrix arctica]
MMSTLLLKNAELVATFDNEQREISQGSIFIRDNVIEQVGKTNDLPQEADQVIDMTDHVVLPGLINTHHHMYQSLTRAVPLAQDAELFTWLQTLYPIWGGLTPEMINVSTQTAMAELLLSGCTTSSDHLYIYPNGCTLDDSIEAAETIGMRFHACRGSMSVGESDGGLPPDHLVENEAAILKDTQRVIESYHDANRHAMTRVGVAPCSPFSVSRELMRDAALLAREYKVGLHTHLAENANDIAYSKEKFGMTPAEYVDDLGWVGEDVWHAHCVQLDDHGIELFSRTGTGVAHCPCSNMRLASGIAPIRKMLDAGVKVGLGVDGSASNDSGHMMSEARQAMLLQRVGFGPAAMTAREALTVATRGSASVLNRDDIGYLAPGMSADIIAYDLNAIGFAGGLHDPLAALIFCATPTVNYSIVNGKVVVDEGRLTTVDLGLLVSRHNELAKILVNG